MVESGPRRGVAIMVFNDDRSLDMFQVISPNPRIVIPGVTTPSNTGTNSDDDTRGTGGDDSRGGTTGSTNSTPTTPPATN